MGCDVDRPRHLKPRSLERHVGPIRRLVYFVLGVAVIIDALAHPGSTSVAELVVGLVLLGLISVEDMVRGRFYVRVDRRNHDDDGPAGPPD